MENESKINKIIVQIYILKNELFNNSSEIFEA